MFTHSTASYFAKQAFNLRQMIGKEFPSVGGYKIDWQVPGHVAVTDGNGTTRLVRIAKAWSGL